MSISNILHFPEQGTVTFISIQTQSIHPSSNYQVLTLLSAKNTKIKDQSLLKRKLELFHGDMNKGVNTINGIERESERDRAQNADW